MSGRLAYVSRTGPDRQHFNTLVPRVFIQLVDEIGLPLQNRKVTVKFNSGRESSFTTDDEGKIYPSLGEGEEVEIKVQNIHEASPVDSSQTESGQHFAANQNGPAGESAPA